MAKKFHEFRENKINEADFLSTPNPVTSAEPTAEPPQQEAPAAPSDPRTDLANKIKPQYEAAKSIVDGLHTAFDDDCGKTTKYNRIGDQIKNYEKQARGACQQVISLVEQTGFNWKDNNQCSPTSYGKIQDYDSRDEDCLKLCAAIIIFYNSLLGVN